ncbi:MAG: hypothetical protein ACTSWV_02860 [Candidatus Asgardarchaeia archaeon]
MKMYNINSDGTLTEIPVGKNELKDDRVLLVVDESSNRIYIWKGKNSLTRKRFIGARQAQKLRMSYGMNYRVVSIEENDEPIEFLALFDRSVKEKKDVLKKSLTETKTERMKVESSPKISQSSTVSEGTQTRYLPGGVSKVVGGVATYPKRTLNEKVEANRSYDTVTRSYRGRELVVEKRNSSLLDEVNSIEVPPDMKREVIIVSDKIYAITEKRKNIFGKKIVETNFEPIENVPDGEFFVEDYVVRVIVRGGKVKVIDFLKRVGIPSIPKEIPEETRKKIYDLTALLKSIKKKKGSNV